MVQVAIQHCTFRIVRRDGWSWGAEPQRLLQGAIKALPALLAQHLTEIWPDDVEAEIAAPVRITVPVRVSELLEMARAASFENGVALPLTATALSARVRHSLEQVFEKTIGATPQSEVAATPTATLALPTSATKTAASENPLLQTLLDWHRQAVLEMRLATFSLSALVAWHDRLVQLTYQIADKASPQLENLAQLVAAAAKPQEVIRSVVTTNEQNLATAATRTALLRRRIIVLIEIVAQHKLSPNHPALLAELNRQLPLPVDAEADERRAAQADSARVVTQTKSAGTESASQVIHRARSLGDYHVASALPFLLLEPLAQINYWQTLRSL